MNIYVSNLSFNVQDGDLRDLFTPFGEVASAKVIMDRETGRSRGFGFVEMNDNAAAKTAISQLEGGSIDGRNFHVSEARAKDDNSSKNRDSYRSNSPFKGGSKW